ncbi:hypothetical protein CBS147326_2828 [Penicillium roqueforti]|nr:hypothetical protein CBS147326_2828 [Penicillium roqueforti]
MRSNLVLLASLAGSALAYPTDIAVDRRTFGLAAEIVGSAAADVGGIISAVLGGGGHSSTSLLAGLSAHGAAALEGGLLGCSAGKIHADARGELKTWLSGQVSISGSVKTSLLSWCEGSTATLSADVLAALSVYIPTCADLASKESLYVTVEGIFTSAELEAELVLSAAAQASLDVFIKGSASLAADVKSGLSVCAAGGVVGSLSADVKASLSAWVSASDCALSAALKASVSAWCEGKAGADLVSVGSISASGLTAVSVGASVGAAVEEAGALSASAQAAISAFLDAKIDVNLSAEVEAALKACAEGKLASSLTVEVRTALAVWLSASSCSLGVELKAVVLLWLSVAVTAEASLDLVTGLFVDITGFLTESVLSLLSINLRGALSLLAAGESLTVLSWEARSELAAFLGGCLDINIGVSIELIIIEWFTGCSIPGAPAPSGSASASVPSLPTSTTSIIRSTPVGPAPTGSVSVPSGPAPSGSVPAGPAPSGSVPGGSIPAGPAPTETGATTTPCETLTIASTSVTVIPASGWGTETVSTIISESTWVVSESTSWIVPGPAPTSPPEVSTGAGSGAAKTVTVTVTETACPCKQ